MNNSNLNFNTFKSNNDQIIRNAINATLYTLVYGSNQFKQTAFLFKA